MIPEKIQLLIKTIIEKTNNNEITWGKTARENEFKLFMDTGAITTDRWDHEDIQYVDLSIYNNFGDKIENFFPDESSKDFEIINELHKSARREFYKVDQTLEGMFQELQSSKKVGKREVEDDTFDF